MHLSRVCRPGISFGAYLISVYAKWFKFSSDIQVCLTRSLQGISRMFTNILFCSLSLHPFISTMFYFDYDCYLVVISYYNLCCNLIVNVFNPSFQQPNLSSTCYEIYAC